MYKRIRPPSLHTDTLSLFTYTQNHSCSIKMTIFGIIVLLVTITLLYTIDAVPTKRQMTFGIPLKPGLLEYSYTLTINFGNQYFTMLFDTGSADLWVPEIGCINCGEKRKFNPRNPTNSLTTQDKPFQLNYSKGKASGYIGTSNL